jgi:large subunit ribosomal protein L23
MKLEPVITEKSMKLAEDGKYTFRVNPSLTKYDVKKLIEETFQVKVLNVYTLNSKGEVKRTMSGRRKIIKPAKKVIVKLGEKVKIDLFETKKK